jgi:hypothetical protein
MMPLELISDTEELVFRIDDAEIYYRRIPPEIRAAIVKKHTKRGEVNWIEAALEMCTRFVTGWKNVGFQGKNVAYKIDLIRRLPDSVLSDLMEAMGAPIGEGVPEKNS